LIGAILEINLKRTVYRACRISVVLGGPSFGVTIFDLQLEPMSDGGTGDFGDESTRAVQSRSSPSNSSLEEQAVEAFGLVQRRVDRDVGPERLRAFLQVKKVTSNTVLGLLADFGRARGLVTKARRLSPTSLLTEAAPGDLVLTPDGNLGVIEETRPTTGILSVHSFGPDEVQRIGPDRLAGPEGLVSLLHIEGETPHFLDSEQQSSAGPDVRSAEYIHDPHDHRENIQETFASLLSLLSDEGRDLVTVSVYAAMVAIFSLTVPLASQGIIDSVSLGTFTNQIVVLCVAITVGLLLYGGFDILKYYTVDMLQRRLFASTSMEMAYRLPLMKRSELEGEYGPALVNRFFDVVSMQKSLTKILLDGLVYALVALVSLILLTVYSSFFLIVGLMAVLFTPVLIWGLGRRGLKTSIEQSSFKYATAHWLEDLARCQQSFKLNGSPSYVHARTDRLASDYVRARGNHFRIFGRQLAAAAAFRAIIMGLALGIGGYLVTQGSITLGQFVAAELLIVYLTNNGFNLVKLFASGYDLLTAISKILHVTEKPLEEVGGEELPPGSGPASLSLRGVTVRYGGESPALDDVSFDVGPGDHVCIVGDSGAGKTTLTQALVRMQDLSGGQILFEDRDIARLDPQTYRSVVGLALPTDELFKGTVEENITMGRSMSYEDVERALHLACLEDEVLELPDGLKTPITSAGLSLPQGTVRRIMIARAVIGEPRLLILDEPFNGIEDPVRKTLADRLYGHDAWTIVSAIDDNPAAVRRADQVLVLERGRIVWRGASGQLHHESDDFLNRHFPRLVSTMQGDGVPS
jgi:ATP-binding cassette subfamily B protein